MIRKFLAGVAVSSALTLGLGVTAGAAHAKPKPTQSIVEIAQDDGHFTTLLAAVGCADPAVGAALTSGERYTVFAPTDDAFATAGLDAANVCTVPSDQLTSILLYHVTEGRRLSQSVLPHKASQTKTIDTLAAGQRLRVSSTGVISTTSGGTAAIVAADIAATNGVIHVIDHVLIPGAPAAA